MLRLVAKRTLAIFFGERVVWVDPAREGLSIRQSSGRSFFVPVAWDPGLANNTRRTSIFVWRLRPEAGQSS